MEPYMEETRYDELLDASGLNCPLPLLKAKQALNKMPKGTVLKVVATDAGSVRDFKSFVDQSDHTMLDSFTSSDSYIYFISRG